MPATRPDPTPTPMMTTDPTDAQADLYAILGLDRYATQAEIAHAYRTLLRRHHPDTRTSGDPSQDALSDAALQQILTAYAVLRDPDRRADYDQRYTLRPSRPSPTIAGTGPVFVSSTQPAAESPLRAGPVRWNPEPPTRTPWPAPARWNPWPAPNSGSNPARIITAET